MHANILIKLLLGVVLIAGAMLGITQCARKQAASSAPAIPTTGGDPLDEDTQIALGIEGDTPDDVVKTLITNVREVKQQLNAAEARNAELAAANQSLTRMEENLFERLRNEVTVQTATLRDSNRQELSNARSQLTQLLDRARLQASAPPNRLESLPTLETLDPNATVWLRPLAADADGGLLPTAQAGLGQIPWAGSAGQGASNSLVPGLRSNAAPQTHITPAYTLAKNATLVGATAFTALIGRVPVGDNIIDPYSFKVIIGRDNLIANGQEIPEFAYAVVSGKAVGDWTLGCVSGDVFSMTFVFEDGHIVTLPKPEDIRDGSSTTRDLKIGELSDDYGNPCVVGRKISNAGKYLAQRVAAVAVSAAARAAAASETTTTFSDLGGLGIGGTTVVTGDKSDFVLDQTLAGGAQEAAQWVRDRQAQNFDAIYVEPGARVAIHVTEELKIDYDTLGRMTHHPGFTLRGRIRELD